MGNILSLKLIILYDRAFVIVPTIENREELVIRVCFCFYFSFPHKIR